MKIAIVADYAREDPSSLAAAGALAHSADSARLLHEVRWFDSRSLAEERSWELLTACDGIFAPGGSYDDREAGSAAIRYAREAGRPFIGT